MFHNEIPVMVYYVSFSDVRMFIVTKVPSFNNPFLFHWLHMEILLAPTPRLIKENKTAGTPTILKTLQV